MRTHEKIARVASLLGPEVPPTLELQLNFIVDHVENLLNKDRDVEMARKKVASDVEKLIQN